MELYARVQGEGPAVILLHGLFGSNDNLGGLARALADMHTVYALDLRNHGRSPHAAAMDLPALAADVHDTMAAHGLDSAVLTGHSLGGKVAMELALTQPDLVEALVVLDIAPVRYTSGNEAELAAMQALDLTAVGSRRGADAALSEHLESSGVRQFLLKNLVRSDSGFAWRIPLDTIAAQYPNLAAAPSAPGRYDRPALFIRGARSTRVASETEPAIRQRFPHAHIETIDDAGHWVHVEAPDTTARLIGRFLAAESE